MKHRRATRSLARPAGLSALLLLAGVVALAARAEVLQRRWEWLSYRESLAVHLHAMATAANPAAYSAPVAPHALSLSYLLSMAADPGLSILVIGAMAMALVAIGYRLAWLPLVVGGLFAVPAVQVFDSTASWPTAVGRAASVAVIAVAVLPLLRATWAVRTTRRPVPVPVAVAAAVAVLLPDLVRLAGPNNTGAPSAPGLLASLAYGVLIGAVALPPAVRVGLLLLPLLALEQTSWVVSNGAFGYSPDFSQLPGPVLLTLLVIGVGAAVPVHGDRLLSLWRKATHHGPGIGSHASEAAA